MFLKAVVLSVAAVASVPEAQTPAPPPARRAAHDGSIRGMECKLPDCLMVHAGDFQQLVRANEEQYAAILQLQIDLAEARKTRRCGVLDVIPPKKTGWNPT